MYKFADATEEDLRKLTEFLDTHTSHHHVDADLHWWVTGEWTLNGTPDEWSDMDDMLIHFAHFAKKTKKEP